MKRRKKKRGLPRVREKNKENAKTLNTIIVEL